MGDKYEEDEEDVEMDFGEECDNTEESDVDVDVQIEEGMGEEDDDDEEEEWDEEDNGEGGHLVEEDNAGPTAELGEEVVGEGSDDEGRREVAIALLPERMSFMSLLGCRGRGSYRYDGAWWPRRLVLMWVSGNLLCTLVGVFKIDSCLWP